MLSSYRCISCQLTNPLLSREKVRIFGGGTDEGLSLVFRNNEASFLLTQDEFVLYTDTQPTLGDLQAFVEAYRVGTLPSTKFVGGGGVKPPSFEVVGVAECG